MKELVSILNFLLPVLYWVTVWCYARDFFRASDVARRLKTPLLNGIIVLHAFYLIDRTVQFDHPPITTVFEIFSVLALTTAFAYRVIELVTRVKNSGYFVLIISFVFQLLSSIFVQDLMDVKPILRSNLLGIHVTSALLGYSAFAISAVYGFLYLMLYHQIKSNRFGLIYENLPNLQQLETMSIVSVRSGFVLLSVAIVVGIFWLPQAFAQYSYFDPKLIGTLIVWSMYGMGLLAKHTIGWQGRKIMVLSIIGFAVSLLSLTVVNVFLSAFHNFL